MNFGEFKIFKEIIKNKFCAKLNMATEKETKMFKYNSGDFKMLLDIIRSNTLANQSRNSTAKPLLPKAANRWPNSSCWAPAN